MTVAPVVGAGVASPEQYRGFPDTTHFPLGDNLELVYCPLTGAVRTMHAGAFGMLQGCRSFAPLEEHARRLCAEFKVPPDQSVRVGEQLAALAAAGLLVSHRQLLDRLRQAAPDAQTATAGPTPITTLGIPTRNRLPTLQRCLASVVAGIRRGPESPAVVLVDDSGQEEQRAACRDLLRSLRGSYPGPLFYAGPEAKERFARRLAEHAGLDPETVSFALGNVEGCPITTGTSRNLLLLHAAGEALLQLDDDTVCQLAPTPGARPGLVFSSQHDPTEFWFPAEDERLPVGPFAPHDLLTVHEQLLGKGLGDCLAALPPGVEPDFDRAGAGFFRGAGGQVRVTAAGVAGTSGMGSSLYFLTLEGESRARLLRSETVYRTAISRQQLLRGVARPTVTQGALCLALNLGLDHRRLLPPFMPVQRNQDGIFATLVKTCCPGACFGFLPSLLVHRSPQPRATAADHFMLTLAGIRSDQVLLLLIRTLAPRYGVSEERNLRVLGEALAELGALPAQEFAEVVRLQVWEQMSGLADQLAGLLRKYSGEPAWWAADVQRLLAGLRGRLLEADYAVPDDLRQAFGPDYALPVFQRLVARFGRLLQCWPAMVAAARDLRSRDVRPAEPV
jgi:hypothetical protein